VKQLLNLNTVKNESFEAELFGAEGLVNTDLSESTYEFFNKEDVDSAVECRDATLLGEVLGETI
jgi:hypothetical protein